MYRFSVFLLWIGLVSPAFSAFAEDGGVIRTHSVALIPPSSGGQWAVTPFFDADELVVHLQLEGATGVGPTELLIDARTGKPWQGDFSALLAGNFKRSRYVSPDDLGDGRLPTATLLQALGCTRQHWGCTVPEDGDVLLLMQWDHAASSLVFDTADMRPLLDDMTAVLAGQADAINVHWSQANWRILELASRLPRWHERWLDAMRSIADPVAMGRVARSYGPRGLNLGQRAFLQIQTIQGSSSTAAAQSADEGLDVRGELELAGHKMTVRQQGLLWVQQRLEAQAQALAKSLMAGADKRSQGRVPVHLTEVLLGLPSDAIRPLSNMLAQQARVYHSEDLNCFSLWIMNHSCVDAAGAPARGTAMAAASIRKSGGKLAGVPTETRKSSTNLGLGGINVVIPGSVALDASQEVAMIKNLPNSAILMAFDEVSGRMNKDKVSLSGLTFTARSLGAVQKGRFEVQITPNTISPLRLTRGAYRVKVRLVLDYTREDSCRGGWGSCLLSKPLSHGKTEQRNAVFYINNLNKYIDTQSTLFGDLLPLGADGGRHYNSELTAVRLSVTNVALELN